MPKPILSVVPDIDQAISASASPKMIRVAVKLADGRVAEVVAPIPLSPEDVLAITSGFATFYLRQLENEAQRTANGRIIIPS